MVLIELLKSSVQIQLLISFLIANAIQMAWSFSKANPYTHFKFSGKASLLLSAIGSWIIGFILFIALSIIFPTIIESYVLLLKVMGLAFGLHFLHFLLMLNKKSKYIAWLLTSILGVGLIYYMRII